MKYLEKAMDFVQGTDLRPWLCLATGLRLPPGLKEYIIYFLEPWPKAIAVPEAEPRTKSGALASATALS